MAVHIGLQAGVCTVQGPSEPPPPPSPRLGNVQYCFYTTPRLSIWPAHGDIELFINKPMHIYLRPMALYVQRTYVCPRKLVLMFSLATVCA